jgi:hypothetical protein
MCRAVKRHPLDLTFLGALIGIKESSEPGMSEIVNTELVFCALTETPGRRELCRQRRSKMLKLTFLCLYSTSLAPARWKRS